MWQKLARDGSDAVIVVGVEPESPAASANFILGDIIASIDGRPIENVLDLKIALSRIPLGSAIGVQIYRAGVRLDVTVTIRERTLH